MFCVPLKNLTVLTGLAMLMKVPLEPRFQDWGGVLGFN